jgi:hypothetical protein
LLQADGCRSELIVPADPSAAELAQRVCDAIQAGDRHAEESRDACGQALNAEGVAALPDGDGTERIWSGLRGPLVNGEAVLLRLASMDALRFDGVATLDLGCDGIRDLTYAGGWLWALAGPSADDQEPGSLWRIRADSIIDGARLRPERVLAALPPFSEAIAIDATAGDAFVLIDGDGEKGPGDANGCPTASRYLHLRVPDLTAEAHVKLS